MSWATPTANTETVPFAAVPADGVYAGWLVLDVDKPEKSMRLPAAISIGTNPTFDGTERRVEAYALDRDDLDLYGTHVAVEFAARIRDTLRFDSVDALLDRMAADVKVAREIVDAADAAGAWSRNTPDAPTHRLWRSGAHRSRHHAVRRGRYDVGTRGALPPGQDRLVGGPRLDKLSWTS